jgi:hypothetical protein
MGGPFIRITEAQPLPPLPESWQRLTPDELRLTPPGFIALPITDQLNGPSLAFGERAWTLLSNQATRLAERLQGHAPLTAVRYADRYLRSPLVFLLLHNLLEGLSHYAGGLTPATVVYVDTARLNRLATEQPRLLFHDWRDGEDRRQVIEPWFRERWPKFIWHEAASHELPHARELNLTWNDGERCTIRLDQGFGYWGAPPRTRPEFPFESEVARQITRLRQASLMIEPLYPDYPTYWYCDCSP